MFQLELLATTNDNARSADTMHNLDNICIIIPKRYMVYIILNHLILYLVYTQLVGMFQKMRDKLYLQYKKYYVLNLIEERIQKLI